MGPRYFSAPWSGWGAPERARKKKKPPRCSRVEDRDRFDPVLQFRGSDRGSRSTPGASAADSIVVRIVGTRARARKCSRQHRRRASALYGSRRWDRSATLNRSGVIEAIHTRSMRFHGRERRGLHQITERHAPRFHSETTDPIEKRRSGVRFGRASVRRRRGEFKTDKWASGSSWAPRSWPDSTRETMAKINSGS
ncbi:uncharacterized protein LOC143152297 [Ptiloglossa arizonensis]|uniref:uncharacterized protein LOC143152297 n=1 Tax=Ptiloglossa arizonensis TaxID=3350558 RepID=UPI003FA07F30